MVRLIVQAPDGRTIIITAEKGELKTDYQGFTGPRCEELANRVEENLKSDVELENREKKPEYYVVSHATVETGW